MTVKDGPVFEWMLRSGLTQEEIQLIQLPGFELENVVWEVQRKREHLAAALQLLREREVSSLDKATARLGERLRQPPPPLPG